MKDQINTIREFFLLPVPHSPQDTLEYGRAKVRAEIAVAQIEAAVGEQEPVAEAVAMPGTSGFTMAALRTRWDQTLRHQVTQQPQAEAVPPSNLIDPGSVVSFAVDRWLAEVANRPLVNKNRRTLDDTWRQVIRRFGGDPDALLGPSHDELAAIAQQKGQP